MLPTVFGENLFDDFFDDSFGMMNARNPLYGKHARNLMKTDIRETDTNYELAIDLPGFKKDLSNYSIIICLPSLAFIATT